MAADRGTNQQGKKVVATAPNVSMWPAPIDTSFDPATATRDYGTNLDRISRTSQLNSTGFVNNDPFNYDAASPEQRAAYNMKHYGQENAPVIGSVDIQNPNAWAGGMGGGGGSSDPRTNSNALNWLKYQNELAAATEARKASAAKYKAMQDYYDSNAWANPYAQLGSQLDAMQTTGQGQIDESYKTALADIAAGYGQASQMTGQGYDALVQALGGYQNPYANAVFNAPQVADITNQYSQYGLNSPELAQQAELENAYNQQGAAGFNTLYDVLRKSSDASQQSRMNEAAMARNFANQQLLAGKGAYGAAAAKQRQTQLDQLINSINEQKFQLEQAKTTKGQTLQEQLLESIGDKAPDQATETKAEKIQRLATEAGSFKEAVKQFAPAYIEKNPKASVAELKKKFPALAKAFK
jgi:hypothetical protein